MLHYKISTYKFFLHTWANRNYDTYTQTHTNFSIFLCIVCANDCSHTHLHMPIRTNSLTLDIHTCVHLHRHKHTYRMQLHTFIHIFKHWICKILLLWCSLRARTYKCRRKIQKMCVCVWCARIIASSMTKAENVFRLILNLEHTNRKYLRVPFQQHLFRTKFKRASALTRKKRLIALNK